MATIEIFTNGVVGAFKRNVLETLKKDYIECHFIEYPTGSSYIDTGVTLTTEMTETKRSEIVNGKNRVYFHKIYNESTGEYLRDFVPVMRVSDSVSGLFDRMEGKFYANSEADMKPGFFKGTYCGRVWDLSSTSPVAMSYVGNLEMLRALPELLGLGGYLVKNDHTRKKLSKTDHHYYADGSAAKLDGSEGHYQAGWGIPWYVKWVKDTTNKMLYEYIRLDPAVGFYKVPVASKSASGWATVDRTNSILVSYCNTDAQYRGGNNNADYDGTYRSFLGKPADNITTSDFLTYARRNGSGWIASSGRVDAAWADLFYAIMGTRYSQGSPNPSLDSNGLRQGGLGYGASINWGFWSTYNGNNAFLPMEAGADKGDAVGSFSYTVKNSDGTDRTFANIPVFFGYKNFYLYLWELCCDEFLECNSNKSQSHWMVEKPFYGNFTFTESTLKNFSKKYSTGPIDSNADWRIIKDCEMNHFELMPVDDSGTSWQGDWTDGYYNPTSTSGLRLCLRSANANNGDRAGFGVLHGSIGLGWAAAYRGSGLCEALEEFTVDPLTEDEV